MGVRAKDVYEVRRENGRRAIAKAGGTGHVAELMGHASASSLSQVFGPNPSRNPSDKLVRRMEEVLDLPSLSLDREDAGDVAAPGAEIVAAVIHLVGHIMESEHVDLTPGRFADVVALAYTDTMDHGGTPREGHIRSVVRLLKR